MQTLIARFRGTKRLLDELLERDASETALRAIQAQPQEVKESRDELDANTQIYGATAKGV